MPPSNGRRIPVRAIAVVAVLACAGALVYFSPIGDLVDTEYLLTEVRSQGNHWWAPFVFLVAYALLNILFIPPQALSIAAVVAWGWAWGGAIDLVVATVTAIFPYLIARSAAREWVEARLRRHERVMEMLVEEEFSLLLAVRMVPLIPYTALNYAAGLTPIRPWPYLVATFLGMIPPVFIFAYFVDALLEGLMRPRDVMLRVTVAGILLALLVVLTRWGTKALRKRAARRSVDEEVVKHHGEAP